MKKRKQKRDWSKIANLFVLVSLSAALVYVGIVLILAPSFSSVYGQRTRSDYVLMLLQCSLGIVAVFLPQMLQKKHRFVIPSRMLVLYTLFLYGAIFLGEVMSFYYNVPHWDTFLHTLSGAMLGALGYTVVTFLNKTDEIPITLSPAFVAFFAFCFALTMGVLWEIYEFSIDALFGTNMQKYAPSQGEPFLGQAALLDTMKDLIVDTIGALVISVAGFISLKYKDGSLVSRLLFRKKQEGDKPHDEPVKK